MRQSKTVLFHLAILHTANSACSHTALTFSGFLSSVYIYACDVIGILYAGTVNFKTIIAFLFFVGYIIAKTSWKWDTRGILLKFD